MPIILIEFSIPIIILFILKKGNEKNLANLPFEISLFKYAFGYFYLDYKDSCYYWEFVRMMERFLIVVSVCFFSNALVT